MDNYSSKWTNDPRSTEELIALALTESDEDAAWSRVRFTTLKRYFPVTLKATGMVFGGRHTLLSHA